MPENAADGIKAASSMDGLMAETQGNRPYNTITKHSMEITPKLIHIGILVFLKVDLYDTNLFLAFSCIIRYFGATLGTVLGNSGQFLGNF